MRLTAFVSGVIAVMLGLFLYVAPACGDAPAKKPRIYWSPDCAAYAVISFNMPKGAYGGPRSCIVVRDRRGHVIGVRDYGKGGGIGSGYTVLEAAWTPDSRFFVYSTANSGGHSPWHTPMHCFDRRQGAFYYLDALFGCPVIDPMIHLKAPSLVTAELHADRHGTLDLRRLDSAARRKARRKEVQLFPWY
jgi:hypothetical protein